MYVVVTANTAQEPHCGLTSPVVTTDPGLAVLLRKPGRLPSVVFLCTSVDACFWGGILIRTFPEFGLLGPLARKLGPA